VIADVQSGNSPPALVGESHDWIVDLMDDVVEVVDDAQSLKLQLATPDPILGDVRQILIYRLIILDEGGIHILIGFNVIYGILSVFSMQVFVSFELICNCSKEAVSIPSHLNHLEAVLGELFPELCHVRLILCFLYE